jgi:hypothetical protein
MGWLEAVWHFTGRFTPQGNIGKYTDQAIEAWVEWNGEPGFLIASLIETGWLDRENTHRLVVHDWAQHADKATKNALVRGKLQFCVPTVRTPCVQCTNESLEIGTASRLPEPVPEPVPVPEPIQKPSRRKPASDGMKHSTDPRHMACKEAIFTYYREKNSGVDPDWNGREGAALGMLLGANPKLTADGMKRLLDHRRDSEVNHSDRPGLWIPNVKSFLNGPIDRYGKPLARANGQPKPRLWKPGELAHV